MSKILKIGFIGCGLIANKRAKAIKADKIVACCDIDEIAASDFASKYNCEYFTCYQDLITNNELDIVFVATIHSKLAEISNFAIQNDIHVFVEKPVGISIKEIESLIEISNKHNSFVGVGYNHKLHPAIKKAKEMISNGLIGEVMYIRSSYGHGGRFGYEKEWRAKKELSGGGELLDQGSHLINLANWFLGSMELKYSNLKTYFWNMQLEDNAFLILESPKGKIASLHASWTEWKNKFIFEIFGNMGKLEISGLGKSYGVEQLTHYKMSESLLPPEIESWRFDGEDQSFSDETCLFLESIKENKKDFSTLEEALFSMKIITEAYNDNS